VPVLVDLQQVSVRRVGRALFEGLSLTVSDGDRLGVVGINGTGKSTLLRIVAGIEAPDEGQVHRGRGSRVGFLEQVPELPAGTVGTAAGEGWEAQAALSRLGMGDELAADVGSLSGGQRKRVALARVLVHPVELLVLDEPTNHLDLAAVAWLEQRLLSFRGGLVLVTHDRHLLDRLTTRMLELDRGRAFVHEGGYEAYLAAKADREEQAASAESTRRNLARRELAWLRRGAKARSRKPQARVDAAHRLIDSGPLAPVASAEIEVGHDIPRLGDKVIDCTGVAFRYRTDGPYVVSGVDLSIGRRERLGIMGANGTGKSTLLDLMAGRLQPTAGSVVTGPTVVVGYYDQLGAALDLTARVRDLVAGPHRSAGGLDDVNLMRRFLFGGDLPFARAGELSGGERRRLQLLLVIAARPNVLFLDEPTNDLDLDTLRVLEDFLDEWPGALVVVSHDRAFLERTTDRLVAISPGGGVAEVPGGVDGWVSGATPGSLAATPAAVVPPTPPVRARPKTTGRPPRAAPGPPSAGGAPAGRLLREAEKTMERLQRERDRAEEALAQAADYVEIARLANELAAASEALEKAEEHWLALALGSTDRP
jgi:ATP-binding cassette subfamily F protein uup